MKKKLLYTTIILVALATLVSQVDFIPTWLLVKEITMFSSFCIAAFAGVVYLAMLWIGNFRLRSSLNTLNWIRSIAITHVVIILIPLSFLFSFVMLPNTNKIFGLTFKSEIKLKNETIYLYHKYCSVPDNACECDNYYSLIYKKNHYLPIMHLLKKVDFYAEEVLLDDGIVKIKASEICKKDIGKELRVKL